MTAERCESCDKSGHDVRITTVVVQGYSYRVCDRCAPVVIPLQLPFDEEERS